MEPRFKAISETTPPNPKAHHGTTEDTEDSAKHSNNISTAIF
ncbi:MAG: hypothetical protein QOK27_421 [Gemmatimonadales bacterium]|nr:hypothetical protein [Gemmatimonadales bacterium]